MVSEDSQISIRLYTVNPYILFSCVGEPKQGLKVGEYWIYGQQEGREMTVVG